MRFYDPDQGRVYIDGIPLDTMDPDWFRDVNVGLVSQEPILFAESIKDNIRYGRPEASDDEVYNAAKIANAHEFIQDFPDGYDTFVGERGTALSGKFIVTQAAKNKGYRLHEHS